MTPHGELILIKVLDLPQSLIRDEKLALSLQICLDRNASPRWMWLALLGLMLAAIDKINFIIPIPSTETKIRDDL
jgi:hypothetical protein